MPNGEVTISGEQVIIQQVSRYHSGTYRCQHKGDAKLFTDKIVNVFFGPEVKVSKIYIHDQGSVHLHLVCQVNSNPVASISWYKDGYLLSSINRGSGIHVYKINHPGRKDIGVYTCFANSSSTGYDSIYLSGYFSNLFYCL